MFNAQVIEYRATRMNRAIWDCWSGKRPESDIPAIEAEYGYKHGWFYDETQGRVFQNDGGRGIVWVDQPVMD